MAKIARVVLFIAALFMCNVIHAQEGYDSGESKFHLSGEGAVAFFDTSREGPFPNDEFRVDEAKLFVEAAVHEDIYFFGEVNFTTREEPDEHLEVGELYIQFENISKLWHQEQTLNARAGRFDIPFGEEYLTRDAIDNPFITHSLSDIWGVDEGIEAYGIAGPVDYVVAVQNGGESILHDFNADKSVTGRITYRANKRIHFSFSAMRTGKIDVPKDRNAELWFGNQNVRTIGRPLTTSEFQSNLYEGDGHVSWNSGHTHAAAGNLHYEDNDSAADNQRDVHYFQLEGVQNIFQSNGQTLYGGIRFSRMTSDGGFPITANGDYLYVYLNNRLTTRITRLTFGAGYRIGRHALLKLDYSFERGKFADNSRRNHENFFGVEAAFRF